MHNYGKRKKKSAFSAGLNAPISPIKVLKFLPDGKFVPKKFLCKVRISRVSREVRGWRRRLAIGKGVKGLCQEMTFDDPGASMDGRRRAHTEKPGLGAKGLITMCEELTISPSRHEPI